MIRGNDKRILRLVLRWVPRIWSLLIFAFALMMILTPDPTITEPVPLEDWFLLSLWGIAVLGLLIAWRWALLGATITVATMFIREFAWVALKGRWLASFLIVWVLFVPPAILFVLDWRTRTTAGGA